MRKFIGHTVKGKAAVYECEVSVVFPKPYALTPGEELYHIIEPKQFKGEQWYSFFFSDTVEEALSKAENCIRIELERNERKHFVKYTEDDVKGKVAEIQILRLK
jgi:hypothetical protein